MGRRKRAKRPEEARSDGGGPAPAARRGLRKADAILWAIAVLVLGITVGLLLLGRGVDDSGQDDIDALSFGNAVTASPQTVFFSTNSSSAGVAGAGTLAHSNAGLCHEEGDEYSGAGGTNAVFFSAIALGLIEAGCPDTVNDDDDTNSLAFGPAGFPVFYSLSPGSPTLGLLAASPADILVSAAVAAPPAVHISAAALGLTAADDIDAVCIFDPGPPFTAGPLSLLFSLAPGSPSLGANTPDDLFVPGPALFKDGSVYGLGTPGDRLDAVKCQEPPAVGGIAEVLVGGGEAPASTGAGSGSSSLLYAAIVGGTAAIALAAAGWYVRRRFRQRRI